MASFRDQKGPTLRKRLDNLEAELKNLQDKIFQRRLRKLNQPPCNTSEFISDKSVSYDRTAKTKFTPRPRAAVPNEVGNEWYSCLKSITRSLAQGSDAIRKIASLTDVTSATETLSSLMPTTTDQDSPVIKNLVAPTDRQLLAYHVNASMPMKSSSDFSAFEKSTNKAVTGSRSDGGISNFLSSSSGRPKIPYKSLQDCKKSLLLENHRLRQQMALTDELLAEVEQLRTVTQKSFIKLKEETKRRQSAERKVGGGGNDHSSKKIRGSSMSMSLSNKPKTDNCGETGMETVEGDQMKCPTVDREVRKITSEELPAESKRSMIEKKYIEEREKRIELEGIVAQFKEDLNAKKKECAQISVGQQLALAMAEQFRAKYEKDSSKHLSSDEETYLAKALKETKRECSRLQEELSNVKQTQEVEVDGKYKERAIRAEFEVKNLQKRLEHFKNRNPLEATVVQSVLDKHKEAYNELVLAKKCSEAEYKARCRSLEGEVARLHGYYEKRVKMLNNKIKDLMVQLQEKMICIDSINTNKDNCDATQLKVTMSEMSLQGRQRDAVISSLNTIIADKEQHIKMLQKEKEEAIEKLKQAQSKMMELQTELDKKGEEIGSLLSELGERSDEIAIKEKILIDQTNTITSLQKTLNEGKSRSREDSATELKRLKEENLRLMMNVNEMAKTISEAEKFKEGQEKNVNLLRQLEKQVYERQTEWEHQISTMSKEKDQAIQTAKFATQKLVTAVGEYESQLKAHKQLQHLLKASLQEKDQKLQQALDELERVNREAARAEQNAEILQQDFQLKFNDVCKVCTEMIDSYPDVNSDFS